MILGFFAGEHRTILCAEILDFLVSNIILLIFFEGADSFETDTTKILSGITAMKFLYVGRTGRQR